MKIRIGFWDILVGLPAGILIFMSTLTFGVLLRKIPGYAAWLDLLILAADAAIVGALILISRPYWAIPTALAAGFASGAILLYLRLSSQSGNALSPQLFGLPGILISLIIPPLTAKTALKHRPIPQKTAQAD